MKSGNTFRLRFTFDETVEALMEHISKNKWHGFKGDFPVLVNMDNVDYLEFTPLTK